MGQVESSRFKRGQLNRTWLNLRKKNLRFVRTFRTKWTVLSTLSWNYKIKLPFWENWLHHNLAANWRLLLHKSPIIVKLKEEKKMKVIKILINLLWENRFSTGRRIEFNLYHIPTYFRLLFFLFIIIL